MILILGGGLAGLWLGRRLAERREEFLILEKNARPGGLCRTERSGGYSWDIGPHGFYSKDPSALAYYEALPLRYLRLRRNVRVAYRDGAGLREVGYPFENGLADLPLRARLECVRGYLAAWLKGRRSFGSLGEWIDEGLGPGISRHFMRPYNEKIWSCGLERISMDLVARKIEPEPPWKILRNSLVSGTVGRAYQARFLYPPGGAGEIPRAVAAPIRDRIRLGSELKRLRFDGERWRAECAAGPTVEADAVVSTLPIPELLNALGEPGLEGLAGEFVFNDTWMVAVGLKAGAPVPRFSSCQWVFFAGPEAFYRVTLMHNFDPERPPTLLAEITRKGEAASWSPGQAVERVLADLRGAGLIPREEDVGLAEARLERYTYPIPTLGLERARRELEDRLAPRRLYLLGRSGRWEYMNTDGVFAGVERFLKERFPAVTA